mmetsp:Transcript_19257/g.26069  ORF Transcript_19257/g.26069 Transcript_19257/m.26069 type:complete len:117 (-) Transcript_19257:495-845(-)|eukprot:CAMPEP_0185593640 /NCGR_PEP_ID=MMETSP0434-20130131/72103_1 /TAXON_ID=626734 ORGANISM="Favella taraikaensis, Strain Fe Narragansett Bay" /NCGR_SAMPLE_ID=MMETSP0434 /ASSEMBLY_ACC=CAM_ASM_000379 /LENGTH=116 /DNA_ID=CAMNT_0028220361 /DNA_START=46 /DNA_END=396 /DNA_ORIENTATION=+
MTVNAHKTQKKDGELPRDILALLPGLKADSEEALLKRVDNPTDAPKTELIRYWKESIVIATIITPRDFLKEIKRLCEGRRGMIKKEEYMSNGKVVNLQYEMPLSELISDFFDQLKS